MEPAHLEQSQMLIILSVTVEETGEKDGVLHVGTHQLRDGLNKTDQTDTPCNCRASPRYLLTKIITSKSFCGLLGRYSA